MEMGKTYSKNEGQQMDETLPRVATKERKEIKLKMARQHSKEGGNHLEQESNRRQWKVLMEGYILQWMDKAKVKGECVCWGRGWGERRWGVNIEGIATIDQI